MLVSRFSKELLQQLRAACYASSLITALGMLSACGIASSATSDKTWLRDGSLALSRPVPSVSASSSSLADTASPRASLRPSSTDLAQSSDSSSIVISRKDKTLTAINPGSAPIVIRTEGAQHLPEGSFSVTLKEENPLWYAPREYFLKRSMVVPEEGSRERFKRAALGSKTIYLNNHTPIHSGPVWMQEIGGIRVSSAEMQQVFSTITVGTRVEIR
jgi:hypothetical protein